jgi:hypothetical protein
MILTGSIAKRWIVGTMFGIWVVLSETHSITQPPRSAQKGADVTSNGLPSVAKAALREIFKDSNHEIVEWSILLVPKRRFQSLIITAIIQNKTVFMIESPRKLTVLFTQFVIMCSNSQKA